jgi:hypothetical protein
LSDFLEDDAVVVASGGSRPLPAGPVHHVQGLKPQITPVTQLVGQSLAYAADVADVRCQPGLSL